MACQNGACAFESFLLDHLPCRYALSGSELVDHKGRINNQCGLVIFDQHTCPLWFAGQDNRIVPTEPVFEILGAKSVLTTATPTDGAENN